MTLARTLLRRLDAAIDRALLGPLEYAPSYSRRGGESGTPTTSSVPANRPGGCTPSP